MYTNSRQNTEGNMYCIRIKILTTRKQLDLKTIKVFIHQQWPSRESKPRHMLQEHSLTTASDNPDYNKTISPYC